MFFYSVNMYICGNGKLRQQGLPPLCVMDELGVLSEASWKIHFVFSFPQHCSFCCFARVKCLLVEVVPCVLYGLLYFTQYMYIKPLVLDSDKGVSCVLCNSLYELDRQSQPSRGVCHIWELQDQLFSTFCGRFGFGAASIFSAGSSACTRSVFCCMRPNRNENYHQKDRGVMLCLSRNPR